MNKTEYDSTEAVFAERRRFYQMINIIDELVQMDAGTREDTKNLIHAMKQEAQELYLIASDTRFEIKESKEV